MIIDSHTHIFPDRIAASAIAKLESFSPLAVAHTDGTMSGLLDSMDREGVDYSVILPVVTDSRQFDSINNFAAKNNSGRIIYFGGIHPDCEFPEEKIKYIASLGLIGVKLHPDYQSTFIDDIRYIRIVRAALQEGLYVTIHSGVDIGMPETVHCTPERAVHLLDAVEDLNCGESKIIFAHFGAHGMADEVIAHLCGKNCLFDTAFTLMHEDTQKLVRIIKAHGADKILFATDSPWSSQRESIDRINALPLDEREKRMILGENAARLFKISESTV